MATRRGVTVSLRAAALLALAVWPCGDAALARPRKGAPARRAVLGVHLQKTRFLVAEPVTLTLAVRNDGTSSIQHVLGPDAPKCQEIVVRGRDGKPRSLENPQALFPFERPAEITLEAGGSASARVVLDVTLADILPKAGRYRVKFRIHCEGDRRPALESNWETLEVVEPTGPDADALRDLRAQGDPFVVMSSLAATPSRDLARRLERFADEHRDSVYAQYVRLSLATYYEKFEKNAAKARATLAELARSENASVSELATERLQAAGSPSGVTGR